MSSGLRLRLEPALWILFGLFVLASMEAPAQALKKEYPYTISYRTNGTLNLKASISRVSDFEGAELLYVEMPSLTFAAFPNPHKPSQTSYSLNPLLWGLSTGYNLLTDSRPHGNLVDVMFMLLEGFISMKLEFKLYGDLRLTAGLDHDFMLTGKYLGARGDAVLGLQYEVDRVVVKALYNIESTAIGDHLGDTLEHNARIEFSYELEKNPVSLFLYYCGAWKPGTDDW